MVEKSLKGTGGMELKGIQALQGTVLNISPIHRNFQKHSIYQNFPALQ